MKRAEDWGLGAEAKGGVEVVGRCPGRRRRAERKHEGLKRRPPRASIRRSLRRPASIPSELVEHLLLREL